MSSRSIRTFKFNHNGLEEVKNQPLGTDWPVTTNQITINPAKHFDSNVQRGASPEELKTYLINSYKVMMSRGIKGCYVYACNPSLRNYLSTFI